MLFWSLALAVTAVACAALYYAGAGRAVNAAASPDTPEIVHLKLQLKEIDADAVAGRLGPAEAVAARGEVARELIRLKADSPAPTGRTTPRRVLTLGAIAATVLVTFGVYGAIGRPDLPAEPLSERAAEIKTPDMSLDEALAKIETQLKKTPDDVRGWTVIAPVYMQVGRYADAANALRKVIAISGESADRDTDLGEALMMGNGGNATDEALALFKSAAALDPAHVRSRYYIAGQLTQSGQYGAAVTAWNDVIKLAKGDEAWLPSAQDGLAMAENKGVMPVASNDSGVDTSAVRGMVDGLATRLKAKGGTIEEWTRLVRSKLVLHQNAEAQAAYDAARAAYPDPKVRTELDVLAADNGLVAHK